MKTKQRQLDLFGDEEQPESQPVTISATTEPRRRVMDSVNRVTKLQEHTTPEILSNWHVKKFYTAEQMQRIREDYGTLYETRDALNISNEKGKIEHLVSFLENVSTKKVGGWLNLGEVHSVIEFRQKYKTGAVTLDFMRRVFDIAKNSTPLASSIYQQLLSEEADSIATSFRSTQSFDDRKTLWWTEKGFQLWLDRLIERLSTEQ